jgi:hypothetical protein
MVIEPAGMFRLILKSANAAPTGEAETACSRWSLGIVPPHTSAEG